MIETTTIIEAIYYLLKKLGRADKIKIVKLLYLADKFHLIRYGRTVTNDDYYAMPYGPVGTTIKDILSFDPDWTPPKAYKYLTHLIEKEGYNYKPQKSAKDIEFEMLSDSDKEALDFVINKFGKMNKWDLQKYTHKYPEWSQYKDLLGAKKTNSERIETVELLSLIKNDPLAVPKEHIEESKKILTGNLD